MKYLLLFFLSIRLSAVASEQEIIIMLSQNELDEILADQQPYAYFGPDVCTIMHDIPVCNQNRSSANLNLLCDRIKESKTTAPSSLIDIALREAIDCLAQQNQTEQITSLKENLENYYTLFKEGTFNLEIQSEEESDSDDQITKGRINTCFCSLKVKKLTTDCLSVRGNAQIEGSLTINSNERIGGNLTVNGSELIRGDLTVEGTIHGTISPIIIGDLELIGDPQDACIIFLDAAMVEKARICTSAIPGDNGLYVSVDGGATQNLRVNDAGGTNIPAPSSGTGLSVTGNALASAITAAGNSTVTAPALSLTGNPASVSSDFILTIDATGVVRQSTTTFGDFIINNGQPGPLVIGTTNATSLSFITNNLTRMSINSSGAVTISTPTAGTALTINGGGETITAGNLTMTAGNIILPMANAGGTQGLLQLGGTGAGTNVIIYEFGTRNLFAGNGAVNSGVTGTDNISIGSAANSALTAANFTIAIGTNASATETDSISIGDTANSTVARTIVIGSRDSTAAGTAPTAGATNAIAIGSASGANAGATSNGLSAIAIGGADAAFSGASSAGDRAIAIGLNATASGTISIALGSASGVVGGTGPVANNTNSIAIGSAGAGNPGPTSTGIASIALGSSDGTTFAGPSAGGDRSIAIGLNARTPQATGIAIGSASGTVGGAGPIANNTNAIAIGSANNTSAGASAAGISSVAIGGADATFAGAAASGDRSIALGVNAASSAALTIAIGTASGTVGGNGPRAQGTNAIALGSANAANAATISSGISSIAIGSADATFPGAAATSDRTIAIGVNATTTAALAIAIGSASGTLGGNGASSKNTNAIAIGSANGANTGAAASGISAVAIGGADTAFAGASATGDRSISIGVGATASAGTTIAIGSASGSAGGNAAAATSSNAVAIGTGVNAITGPIASGAASVAIGSANGVVAGANAGGARSVALGNGANTAQADAIILGNPAVTTSRVGIGTNAPNSKVHIVGQATVPVIRLAAGSTAITSQPVWTNPATVAVAGTPIHYNASNQLFGFTSSARYKQNIRDITTESDIIYKLNPVIYDPKVGHGEGKDIPGFIAEQVFEVAPTLAILNSNGQPENVAYNSLHALAIKEIQKQQILIEEQQRIIDEQGILIDQLLKMVAAVQAKQISLLI